VSGLRERKKDRRREGILGAARSAFGELGFEAASMAAIAERADLGVGTLYNYFPSKGDLLLGLIASRSGGIEAAMDEALERAYTDKERALGLGRAYLESLATLDKRIWREFLAFAIATRPELLAMVRLVDTPFIDRLGGLFGLMRCELLYGSWIHRIMEYLADEAAPESSVLEGFAEDLSALADDS
jgi:AcrR family transcriptional regulator